MESLFGGLINYEDKTQLDEFVNKMDKKDAMKIIELSLLFCQKNGSFSFEESHYIFKALSKLNEN